ncbi:MAG TPA: hypothetical protein VGA65_06560 [Hyphomicrobium sp.]
MTTLELVPHTRQTDEDYVQPIHSALDVSPFSDVVLQLSIATLSAAGEVGIYVATAMENRDERYIRVYTSAAALA